MGEAVGIEVIQITYWSQVSAVFLGGRGGSLDQVFPPASEFVGDASGFHRQCFAVIGIPTGVLFGLCPFVLGLPGILGYRQLTRSIWLT